MKSIFIYFTFSMALAACSPKESVTHTAVFKVNGNDKKDSVRTLLNHEFDVTRFQLGSKLNIAVVIGFKGLKLNADFNHLIIDQDMEIGIDTEIDDHIYRPLQFKAYNQDIKTGKGNIQKKEIHQKKTWATVFTKTSEIREATLHYT